MSGESATEFELLELAPGVRLHVARSGRWKTTLAIARVAASLAEDATRTALVPFVLARGTERLPSSRELAQRLEELYDADLAPDVVRAGDAQAIEVRLEILHPRHAAARGADTLREGMALLGDVLFRPARGPDGLLREEHVEQEKKNLRTLILGLRDDRAEYALERTARLLGRGGPSERHELGAVEDLPGIGRADLTARWRALVERYPIDVLVVGDHDLGEVEAAARAAFPLELRAAAGRSAEPTSRAADPAPIPLPVEAATPAPLPPAGAAPAPVREVERAGVKQARLCIGWRSGVRYLGPHYAPFLVLHGVLGAEAQSRLFLEVRERAGLAYEAATVVDRLKGTLIAHFGTDPADTERVEALALREVDRVREELVSARELAEAKRAIVEQVREIADDPARAALFEYARTLAGRRDVTLAALVSSIEAVRAEDVREVARRLVLDCVYVLGP